MPQKEIIPLYRIYDIKNKKYIPEVDNNDEYIVLQSGKVARLKRLDTDNSILFTLNQDDYIVEKCTGRQDKNGNDIYEGDKLRGLTRKEPYVQKTSKLIIGLVVRSDYNDGRHIRSELPNGYRTYLTFGGSEIIGNKRQNPELS